MEGNQQKMREALEAFVESVEWLCEGDESGKLKRQFKVLLSAARAALSAPPRNCDLPFYQCTSETRISDSVWREFKRKNPESYFDAFGLLHCIDWLLSPAAERKGEGNGGKQEE